MKVMACILLAVTAASAQDLKRILRQRELQSSSGKSLGAPHSGLPPKNVARPGLAADCHLDSRLLMRKRPQWLPTVRDAGYTSKWTGADNYAIFRRCFVTSREE